MEFTIERAQLIKHLAHVEGIVESRHTLPILSNVMIEAKKNSLILTTTDIDITACKTISEVEVKTPGKITIQMALLSNIVKKSPENSKINFQVLTENNKVIIIAGRAKYYLAALSAQDFPDSPFKKSEIKFEVSTEAIENAFKRVRAAISTEETRYYLNGIYFVIDNGKMLAVATDGHRLSISSIDAEEIPENLPTVILPKKAVAEILKLVTTLEGMISVEINERAMRFTIGDVVLQSKLIDGTFPDYERAIPTDHKIVAKMQANELATAIDRISTISSEKTRGVSVEISKNSLKLSVKSIETGTATEEIACTSDGELNIGFNGRYLLDLLSIYGNELIEIQLNNPSTPAKFFLPHRPHDINVLMPMRT